MTWLRPRPPNAVHLHRQTACLRIFGRTAHHPACLLPPQIYLLFTTTAVLAACDHPACDPACVHPPDPLLQGLILGRGRVLRVVVEKEEDV